MLPIRPEIRGRAELGDGDGEGGVCWLTLPRLESLQAEVVWWDNNQCGCAFTSLLSPIVHDNILARYRGERRTYG